MPYVDLFVEPNPLRFAGSAISMERAKYIVIGVPFDTTSSYKPGSRFAPSRIREASLNIESNSLSGIGLFIEDVPMTDIGDISVVHGDPVATLDRISKVAEEIARSNKILLSIGGEHTITAGIMKGLASAGRRPCLAVFDAHLDLRDDYLGCRHGHASAIRRAIEAAEPPRILYIGARAYAREELEYAQALRGRVEIIDPLTVRRLGPRNVAARARMHLSQCSETYISFDIDGIDPSYAPGTGTPEPLGLDVYEAFRILSELVDSRLIGADLVEVNPMVDLSGITSVLGARILQEIALLRESSEPK